MSSVIEEYSRDSVWRIDPPGGRHRIAAIVAALVSFVLHIFLLVLLPEKPFPLLPSVTALLQPRHKENIRLGDVALQPEPEPVAPAGRTAHAARNGAGSALDNLNAMPQQDPADFAPAPLLPERLLPSGNISPPESMPDEMRSPQPDVLVINNPQVQNELPGLERRIVPKVERVRRVSEMTLSPALKTPGSAVSGLPAGMIPGTSEIKTTPAITRFTALPAGGAIDPRTEQQQQRLFAESAEEISPARPLENFLRVRVSVYESWRDREFGYFRLDVARRGEAVLPVMPKDIVLIQDASASMTEKHLYFCREGLRQGLRELGVDDRFNIMTFRDEVELCFDEWRSPVEENIKQAGGFIDGIKAYGGTDIFESMREMHDFIDGNTRPVVAVLISDGLPTAGLRESTDIIGGFTKMNQGRVSVFNVGIAPSANKYLLDLLSYCNRGDVVIEHSGRWGLPETIAGKVREVSRLVLADVSFVFAGRGMVETYPVETANMYLDRPLVIYGRYPRGLKMLVFRAAGTSGGREGDMIFQVPLSAAEKGSKEIRDEWAYQKVYYLLGLYARTRDSGVMQTLRQAADEYGVRIPYRREL